MKDEWVWYAVLASVGGEKFRIRKNLWTIKGEFGWFEFHYIGDTEWKYSTIIGGDGVITITNYNRWIEKRVRKMGIGSGILEKVENAAQKLSREKGAPVILNYEEKETPDFGDWIQKRGYIKIGNNWQKVFSL